MAKMTEILALDIATVRNRYVYALYAGRQMLPCYIGVGKGDRLHQHVRDVKRGALRGNTRKFRTLRACLSYGVPISAQKLASNLSVGEAYAIEAMLIEIYGRRDLNTGCLLNASAGGHGPRKFRPSTIKKLAEAGRRHMARPEIRAMLNERKSTPEARAKQRAKVIGNDPSAEARSKMAAAVRARNAQNPDQWAAFLACRVPGGNRGHKQTLKAKAKISQALRDQWADPIIRQKRSVTFQNPTPKVKAAIDAARFGRQTMLGKKHSEKTRIQMSTTQTMRQARDADISP
jgi:hypothetical protein